MPPRRALLDTADLLSFYLSMYCFSILFGSTSFLFTPSFSLEFSCGNGPVEFLIAWSVLRANQYIFLCHMGARDPCTWAAICCPPRCFGRKLDGKVWSWGSNPQPDTGYQHLM